MPKATRYYSDSLLMNRLMWLLYALQAATNLGNNISNVGKPVQNYHPSSVLPFSAGTSMLPAPVSSFKVLSAAASAPSAPLAGHPDVSDPINSSRQIANLVKPSSFYAPSVSSSAIAASPASTSVPVIAPQPSLTLQRPYGAPLLQPFPPPTPSPSLTPCNAGAPACGPTIDRDKVREALMMLVQVILPSFCSLDICFVTVLYWPI